jgi:hypothetical protein
MGRLGVNAPQVCFCVVTDLRTGALRATRVELRRRQGSVVAMKGSFGFIETEFSDGERAEAAKAVVKAKEAKAIATKLRAAAAAVAADEVPEAAAAAENKTVKAEAAAAAAATVAAEGKAAGKLRLFFHSAEVDEGVELGEGDAVEFMVVSRP